MPVMTAVPLAVSDEQRMSLERMARSTSLPHRTVVQARALLLAADGVGTNEVARRCGTTNDSVRGWRRRFEVDGVEGVGRIAPGRGRKSWLPEGTVAEVVRITLEEKPDDTSTHWTTRSLADRLGIGKDTVARIWRDHKLKPWRVETFKLSKDARFEEKLVDIVGLYLNPPERAAVFCFDEKTQCQALDRTQPSLPMKPGRAGTMTHDYKRNGTTDLFAALNVVTGEVLYDCRKRHTGKDVLAFFKLIDLHVPRDLAVHVVLDNLSAHMSPEVTRWLDHPKRVAPALHPHQLLVAQPRRALVQRDHRSPPPPRRVHKRRRAGRRHRDVGRALERRSQALRLAQDRRRDHREGPPWTATLTRAKSATHH